MDHVDRLVVLHGPHKHQKQWYTSKHGISLLGLVASYLHLGTRIMFVSFPNCPFHHLASFFFMSHERLSFIRRLLHLSGESSDLVVEVSLELVGECLAVGLLVGRGDADQGRGELRSQVLEVVQISDDGVGETGSLELSLLGLDGSERSANIRLERAVDVGDNGLAIRRRSSVSCGVLGGSLDVGLKLRLGVGDGGGGEDLAVPVVGSVGQLVGVRVDGLQVSQGLSGAAGQDHGLCGGGKVEEVLDGNHFGGGLVWWGGFWVSETALKY